MADKAKEDGVAKEDQSANQSQGKNDPQAISNRWQDRNRHDDPKVQANMATRQAELNDPDVKADRADRFERQSGQEHSAGGKPEYGVSGALAEIQRRLADRGVRIYSSSGVTDGNGHFRYVIYLQEADHQAAARVLTA